MDYETVRQRHLADFMVGMAEHLARLEWSEEQVRAERVARLRELIGVAVERSPWHRARLAGVEVSQLDAAGLAALPVMTKADLMANYDDILTDRRLSLAAAEAHLATLADDDAYLLDEFHVIASGGSSGERGVFVWGWDAWTAFGLSTMRHGIRGALTAGHMKPTIVMATVAAGSASHATAVLTQTFASPNVEQHRIPVTLPTTEIVSRLNAIQPDGLVGYPSILHELAVRALHGELRIAPLRVMSTSEPLTPETRGVITAAWGASISNGWGTSEAGSIASGCGQSEGMHLAEDLVIVEPVDENGRPVPPGTPSAKVYITNLVNHALPLIRYELTDQVTVLEDRSCPCGCVHRRVADIQGRLDDRFAYPGGVLVHPHVFRTVLTRTSAIVEYQVIQTNNGAQILTVTRDTLDVPALERALQDNLARAGLSKPLVEVRPTGRLDRLASGKIRRFVPLAAPEPATSGSRP